MSKWAMREWANSQPWSNLSKWLNERWAIWANEWMSNEQMSKFSALGNCLFFFEWITHLLIFSQKNEQFAHKMESNFSAKTAKMAFFSGLGFHSFVFRANCSFLVKKWANERFTKKMSDSLIRSLLVSEMSDSLTIAHFLIATWANHSWSLIFGEPNERFAPSLIWFEQNERFTHIAYHKRGNE